MIRLVIVTTHPIQYQAPLFRELARRFDLTVLFLMRQTPQGQAASGFGVEFEWDVPLLDGYHYVFANNIAKHPSSEHRNGIILQNHGELLTALKPDVVLTMGWFPRGKMQVIQWATRQGVPLVCRSESNLVSGGSPLKRLAKWLCFPHLLNKFATCSVIGRRNHEFYRNYGVPESRLYLAPYSVDTKFFEEQFRAHRSPTRKPGPWRIGFAGKLISRKRPLDLVAAAASSPLRDKMQLVIIGDGPLRNEIETRAKAGQVKVDFRGFLNQSEMVSKGYADLDAFVLPSDFETWGLVVNEVMTGGIPVIVSDACGCAPDLVVHNMTGFQFPARDVAVLTNCLDQLVAQLESGHDFSSSVFKKIAAYSLGHTADGLKKSITAARRCADQKVQTNEC